MFRTADGITLVADVAGSPDAPTVVLAHGGGQTRHSWKQLFMGLVNRGYSVVNYDARGHGDSDWAADGDYTIPALSRDLCTILPTIKGPVALVGASMGGASAFYAIGSSPQPIAKALIMVDIVPRPAKKGTDHIHAFMTAHPDGFETLEEAADAVATYYPDRERPKDSTGLNKNLRASPDGRLRWHWDPALLNANPSSEPPLFTEHMIGVAARVTLPTLLIRGGRSDIVDEAGVAEMRALVPQTEVFEVPDAGHMVAGDRNDAFNEGVFAFLDRRLPLH
ncbi:Alpha/beta hydrolase fold protein [Sphingobium herbicidovorans NBRC 16415]|uniref:Alpha/beta hydrolase fold protein n=1 Tax=Sphingobium herbicidovorans (strain ATCC 700291 / DSM 11019 / CCUG 56400 / KCTC 2939 / LMG 18315 / NBRC 16415 / MH) TaxID=1219045 RepID=A0A086PC17_SPHHM|nr:alpha/beta hydrolase [Sphingobium herbicidovorans]KFG90935.1 Alpha/beta hydrolase fold protein [Sphingobium herbicidovorans NBRC 16415]